MTDDTRDLTALLGDLDAGRPDAVEKLSAAVYDQLCAMAHCRMERKFGYGLPGVTFAPTEIADESFMRLIRQRKKYDNSGQFFAIAARQMMRVLVDYYRTRKPRHQLPEDFDVADDHADDANLDLEALDRAIEGLRSLDPRKADVVIYRYFLEFTIDETADVLAVTHATIERDWAFAKAWLAEELGRKL